MAALQTWRHSRNKYNPQGPGIKLLQPRSQDQKTEKGCKEAKEFEAARRRLCDHSHLSVKIDR